MIRRLWNRSHELNVDLGLHYAAIENLAHYAGFCDIALQNITGSDKQNFGGGLLGQTRLSARLCLMGVDPLRRSIVALQRSCSFDSDLSAAPSSWDEIYQIQLNAWKKLGPLSATRARELLVDRIKMFDCEVISEAARTIVTVQRIFERDLELLSSSRDSAVIGRAKERLNSVAGADASINQFNRHIPLAARELGLEKIPGE
ncbi:MAG: hypothetical protein J5J00_13715 [Deltaproteobacteria bacterium]|nr:hypothetical protein [Deltaproteobacteria bacterium]